MKYYKLFIATILISHSVFAEGFVEVPQKELSKKIRNFAYAAIRTSITKPYQFSESKQVLYTGCPEEFPELPGNFPCSFLEYQPSQTPSGKEAEAELANGVNGGKIEVYFAKTKSPILEGLVATFGYDPENKANNEDQLTLFFRKDSYLSHYTYKNEIVMFRWAQQAKNWTLVEIFVGKLNSQKFIESGKEINFSKPK